MKSAIPNSTTSDTKYYFKLWNDWCEYRLKCQGDVIPLLSDLKSEELSENLKCFIFQIRKRTMAQRAGLGSQKKKAEPLTEEEEELLWNKGLLGCKTPQALVDTVLFMNGVYFALRSGSEHRQLRSEPCQIQVIEVEGQRSYLKYTEDISKIDQEA